MVDHRNDQTANLNDTLECPACRYSLRGLPGEVVNCPECGLRCDRAALIATQWDGSWRNLPNYNALLVPSGWMMLAGVAFLCAVVTSGGIGSNKFSLFLVICAVVFVGVWIVLLARILKQFQSWRGVTIIALMHMLPLLYLVAIVGAVVGVAGTFASIIALFQGQMAFGHIIPVGVFVASWFLLNASHRIDQFVARQCIRLHLLRLAAHRNEA